LIKVGRLDAGIALRVVGAVLVVFSGVGEKFAQSDRANGKQGPIPEEIYQTWLTSVQKYQDQIP
jgi:hypothetical protein